LVPRQSSYVVRGGRPVNPQVRATFCRLRNVRTLDSWSGPVKPAPGRSAHHPRWQARRPQTRVLAESWHGTGAARRVRR
jgi:hypothetical protein